MRFTSASRVLAIALPFGAMASACSGSHSGNAGSDASSGAPNLDFQPANPPENACSLLTAADVATLLPNAEAGRPSNSITNNDAFLRGCRWESPGQLTAN